MDMIIKTLAEELGQKQSYIENVVSIESATLVSKENSVSVLKSAYENLVKTDSVSMRIVDGKHYYFVGSRYGTIKYGDVVQEVEIPARIIKYGSDEGATLPFTKVDFTIVQNGKKIICNLDETTKM